MFDQAWMYIHGTGGQLTRFFEDSVFPEEVHPMAGPIGGWPTAYRPDTNSMEWHSDSVYLYVVYTLSGPKGFKPAVGAKIWGYLKRERGAEDLGSRRVPDSGIVAFKCAKGYGEYVAGGGYAPETPRVQGRDKITSWLMTGCGKVRGVEVEPQKYYPWRQLNLAANAITEHFGRSRKMVKWKLNFDPKNRKSVYNRLTDKITLAWRTLDWSLFRWVVAHEYGHAYHHKALGGMFDAPKCSDHWFDKVTSYGCALSEGFANYTGVVGSDGYYKDCFEHFGDSDRPGASFCRKGSRPLGDKPKIEGHITALIMDLIDEEEESGDWVEYPAKYVATVFKTCEVQKKRLKFFKKWHDRSNVSDFVWCLQNQIHPADHKKDSVFGDLDHPLAFREKAEEPDKHDPIRIMWTWEHNLK